MTAEVSPEVFFEGCVYKSSSQEMKCPDLDCSVVHDKLLFISSLSCGRGVKSLRQIALDKSLRVMLLFLKESRSEAEYKNMGNMMKILNEDCVSELLWRAHEWRPPWIPMDLLWVEADIDPYLRVVALAPQLKVLTYSPVSPLSVHPLTAVLSGLPLLQSLRLQYTASDTLLRLLHRDCPHLKVLSVQGSKGVTDSGLRRLLLLPSASHRCAWHILFKRWRELLPYEKSRQYKTLLPPVPAPELRTVLCSSLEHLDLRETRVTECGAQWAAQCLYRGHILISAVTRGRKISGSNRYFSLEEGSEGPFGALASS